MILCRVPESRQTSWTRHQERLPNSVCVKLRLVVFEGSNTQGGKPNKNDARALVICLLLKIWLGKPYRDLVSILADSTYLWPIIGLEVLPGRMDLQRAMNRLGREYLDTLNQFVVEQRYYGKKDARQRSEEEESSEERSEVKVLTYNLSIIARLPARFK